MIIPATLVEKPLKKLNRYYCNLKSTCFGSLIHKVDTARNKGYDAGKRVSGIKRHGMVCILDYTLMLDLAYHLE